MSAPSLDRSREAFMASLATKAAMTRRTYATALDKFRNFLGEAGVVGSDTPEAFTPATLEDFYLWGTGLDLDPSTMRTYLGGVRAYLRYCERRGWLRHPCSCVAMAENLKAVMPPYRYKTPMIDNGAARLVVALRKERLPGDPKRRLEALRDRVVVSILYATGMRRQELASLNASDLREDRALVRGKGDRHRLVYFDQPSLDAARAYLAARGDAYRPLLIRHDDARGAPGYDGERWRLSSQSVWATVRQTGWRHGIDVHPHDFRHLKARVLLNDGANMGEVQKVLGHESFATTERVYAPYSAASIERAWRSHSVPAEQVAADASRYLDL